MVLYDKVRLTDVSNKLRKAEESKWYPGFYLVPDHPNVCVNKMGDVLILATGNIRYSRDVANTKANKIGYQHIRTFSVSKNRIYAAQIHRLVALTFLEREDENHVIVNHKDGNKYNNEYTNLEWCTHSANSHHAFASGIRGDSYKVQRLDLETNEVKEWHSLGSCAASHNTTAERIHSWLKSTTNNIRFGRYIFRRSLGDESWGNIDALDRETYLNGAPKPVMAMFVETGKISIYDTIGRAAAATNVKHGTICALLRYNRINAVDGYAFFRLTSKDKLPTLDDIKAATAKLNTGMLALDIETGDVYEASSALKLSEQLGVEYGTMVKAVARKNLYAVGKYIYKRMLDERPWPSVENLPSYIKGRPHAIKAINIDTKRNIEYPTVREMAKVTGLRESDIAKRARENSNTHLGRYIFRYCNSDVPFPELTKEFVNKEIFNAPKILKRYDILTGKVDHPVTVTNLAKELSTTTSTINRHIRNGTVVFRYLIKSIKDVRPWPTLRKIVDFPDSYGYISLYWVRNINTGEETLVNSIVDVSKLTGVAKHILRRDLNRNENFYVWNAIEEALRNNASITEFNS